VVARWRADVDYVAAGIYCFQVRSRRFCFSSAEHVYVSQPYCVTGELEPPANPLICPQFCLRFNDLDNIGSGRFSFRSWLHWLHWLRGSRLAAIGAVYGLGLTLRLLAWLCLTQINTHRLTGRHYSGFIMLGIQVFNKPDAYVSACWPWSRPVVVLMGHSQAQVLER